MWLSQIGICFSPSSTKSGGFHSVGWFIQTDCGVQISPQYKVSELFGQLFDVKTMILQYGKLVNFQYIWWFDNDDAKQVCELEGYGIPWHSYNTHLLVGWCSFVLIEVKTLWRAQNMKYRNTCHHQINIVNCQLEYNVQNMNN